MSFLPLSGLLAGGRAADHLVAVRGGENLSFARFFHDVSAAVGYLRRTGCRRPAIMCADTYLFAVGLWAALHAGAVAVVPPNDLPGTRQALAGQFDLWLDDAALAKIADAPVALASLDSAASTLAFFTSGTTGNPKRVIKSLAALEREVAVLESLWGGDLCNGICYATVPHQHVYGITFKLLWPLASGRAFATATHNLWENLLADLGEDTVIVSSPSHLTRLAGLHLPPTARSPRMIITAGAPLPRSASDEAAAIFGVRPTEIFGSTETGVIATRRQTEDVTSWRLLPGIEIDPAAGDALRLKSPFMAGQDWYDTGDLIARIEGGFHWLGRVDRIAKIEGKRLSLAGIERDLIALPWVGDAAVLVLPGSPERLACAVVPSASGRIELGRVGAFRFGRALRDALSASQEPAGRPKLWRFPHELPAGPMGKRSDTLLRGLFEAAP